jgi:hypothetical protein
VHRPEEPNASHWRTARDYGRLYDDLTLYFRVGWREDGSADDHQYPAAEAHPDPIEAATRVRTPAQNDADALARSAAGSLLAMPTSWFGGGWLTKVFDLDEILSWYLTSLAVCFLAIGGYPLFRAVIRIGNELGTAK